MNSGHVDCQNADVVSASEFDLGRTSLVEHTIELNSVAYLPLIDEHYCSNITLSNLCQEVNGSRIYFLFVKRTGIFAIASTIGVSVL